jgi:hypothetical protein
MSWPYQHGGGSGTVEPDFSDVDPVVLQLPPDDLDELAQLDVDGGEVVAAVDRDVLAHQVVQPPDLGSML